jgi:hypothetical protein
MKTTSWLILLYALRAGHSTTRVNLWRKLKRFGAIQLKTSAYLLPDEPTHHERFQWLAKQIRDDGGEATLIRAKEIEGLPHEKVVQLFNDERAKDYEHRAASLKKFIERNKKRRTEAAPSELEKAERRFQEIQEIDYFDCPAAHDALMVLKRAQGLLVPRTKAGARLNPKEYVGKTWLTRPRPEIDRVGSAWLIRKFIDGDARFIFSSSPAKYRDALPFDMADVEFTHHGDDCTFETLIKRFGIEDEAAQKIGEMIHDADLEDDKFHRPDCIGIDHTLKGWARLGLSDEEILEKGSECFDALYVWLRER